MQKLTTEQLNPRVMTQPEKAIAVLARDKAIAQFQAMVESIAFVGPETKDGEPTLSRPATEGLLHAVGDSLVSFCFSVCGEPKDATLMLGNFAHFLADGADEYLALLAAKPAGKES